MRATDGINPVGAGGKERFFPSGAIFFFALLLVFYAALWLVIYWIMIARSLTAMTVTQLEKRIFAVALLFVVLLFGFAALAINLFHVGLPTCLTDIKPFQKGELITHSPTHYEVHYVARMWRFDPERGHGARQDRPSTFT